ncbi:MAG: hypothetical protein AB7T37_15365 [Dehalococcoidia bacterium]
MNAGFSRPRGVTIDITLPRWPLNLVKIGFGILLLLMIVAAVVAIAFETRSSSGAASTMWDVSGITRSGDIYRLDVKVERSGDGGTFDLRGWSLLLDDGSVVTGTLVGGPERITGEGTADVVVEFPASGDAAPAWVRLRQDDQPLMSVPVRLGESP